MSRRSVLLTAVAIVAVLLLSTVTYQVDQLSDIVLVKTFFQVSSPPLMGAKDAGLRFKWPYPIQSLTRYDARDSILEDPYEQILTKDNQSIILNTFCNWRIEDAVTLDRRVSSAEKAQASLRALLKTVKGNVIARYNMGDIINTDPSKMKLGQIESDILAGVSEPAMREYGIRVTNVGVKVLGLPEGVSQAVIDNQIKERQQEAANYSSAGDAQATAITKRAQSASEEILAFANRRAEFIRTEGKRDAARYYGTFHQNERLAMYLRALDSIKREIGSGRAVFVLDSSQNPALEFFHKSPSLEGMKVPQAAQDSMKQPTTAPAAPRTGR
jgi:membrane protease subunit HflC